MRTIPSKALRAIYLCFRLLPCFLIGISINSKSFGQVVSERPSLNAYWNSVGLTAPSYVWREKNKLIIRANSLNQIVDLETDSSGFVNRAITTITTNGTRFQITFSSNKSKKYFVSKIYLTNKNKFFDDKKPCELHVDERQQLVDVVTSFDGSGCVGKVAKQIETFLLPTDSHSDLFSCVDKLIDVAHVKKNGRTEKEKNLLENLPQVQRSINAYARRMIELNKDGKASIQNLVCDDSTWDKRKKASTDFSTGVIHIPIFYDSSRGDLKESDFQIIRASLAHEMVHFAKMTGKSIEEEERTANLVEGYCSLALEDQTAERLEQLIVTSTKTIPDIPISQQILPTASIPQPIIPITEQNVDLSALDNIEAVRASSPSLSPSALNNMFLATIQKPIDSFVNSANQVIDSYIGKTSSERESKLAAIRNIKSDRSPSSISNLKSADDYKVMEEILATDEKGLTTKTTKIYANSDPEVLISKGQSQTDKNTAALGPQIVRTSFVTQGFELAAAGIQPLTQYDSAEVGQTLPATTSALQEKARIASRGPASVDVPKAPSTIIKGVDFSKKLITGPEYDNFIKLSTDQSFLQALLAAGIRIVRGSKQVTSPPNTKTVYIDIATSRALIYGN